MPIAEVDLERYEALERAEWIIESEETDVTMEQVRRWHTGDVLDWLDLWDEEGRCEL